MDSTGIVRPPLLRNHVLQILRDEISHRRPAGAAMPSEWELARQFRISRKTVRAAYDALEREGLIERIRGKGTFVSSRVPRPGATGELALVFFASAMQMFLMPFYARLTAQICTGASRAAFTMRLFTHDSGRKEYSYDWREHAESLGHSAAAIAIGVFKPESLQLLSQRMPVIAVDAGGPFKFCDSVAADDFKAGRIATQHLLALGHRRIGFLGGWGPSDGMILDPAHVRRYEGHCAAMREAGIEPDENLRYEAEFRAVSAALESPEPPTAFVARDDGAACEAIDAAIREGRRVPEDVSIVGIGNVVPPGLSPVPLTTVDLHPEQMGQLALELAQNRLNLPGAPWAHNSVDVDLVDRGSTGPAS